MASFDLSVAGKKVAATVSKAVPTQAIIQAAAGCMLNKLACAAAVAAVIDISYVYNEILEKVTTPDPTQPQTTTTPLGQYCVAQNIASGPFYCDGSFNSAFKKVFPNLSLSSSAWSSRNTASQKDYYSLYSSGNLIGYMGIISYSTMCPAGSNWDKTQAICAIAPTCTAPSTYDSVTGMCVGSVINEPANRQTLEADIAETLNGPNKEQKIPSLLDELIGQGFPPTTDEEPKAESADPSTVTAPPTTETRSYFDQATSHPMTAVTTTTDTYSIAPTAAGDAFDVSKTSAQTQAITDGVTGVTTTSTSAIAYGSDTSTKPVESEQLTDCDKYPDAVGCLKLGTIQSPETLTTTPVNASFTSTSWGSGSCPADVAVAGHFLSGAVFSYAPVCQFLSSLAPVLIAVGWLMAGWFVLGGVRD
ncbi:virulence factor TspB C-terminal domain-related protein [Methylomonas rapida]|uniref:Virulence factor TspB C-terminal domain-related protein n=1 Tax=Methylomonas rapida TaxID=2963939 RepID=A0ABY7GDC4_9GAMM|nr:virulence factor TspB C-terminal domain-related protein [Methylomonas rapida]WAR42977.1 virulence factor TspB C-terminal domain-related protein [Methylomonas rapida]